MLVGLPMMRGGLSMPPDPSGTGFEWKRSCGGNRLIIGKSSLKEIIH